MAEQPMTTEQDNLVTDNTVLGSSESDNQTNDWRENLPEELKNDPTLQNINDPESAAKTLIHQQKMMGNRIPIPKTDEEKSELYAKLGRPESADKYEVQVADEFKQYMPESSINNFKNVAHQIGLNNEQANAIIKFQQNEIQNEINNSGSRLTVERQETEQQLQQEWGASYSSNLRAAQRAIDVYGSPELQELLNGPAGNHPAVVKFMAAVGAEVTEDMAQNTMNNTLAVSALDADGEIQATMQDSKHPYHNAAHPDHKVAVERMAQLFAKKHGS